MSRAQRYFFDYCLHINLEQFVNDTNIRKLLENEIKRICGDDAKKRSLHLNKISSYEVLAFEKFINLEESWCWTCLSDLKFKDDSSESHNRSCLSFSCRTILSRQATPSDSKSMDAGNAIDRQSPEPTFEAVIERTLDTTDKSNVQPSLNHRISS